MSQITTTSLSFFILFSFAAASANECPVEKAVYFADNRAENVPPDELRFSFEPSEYAKPWKGFPTKVQIKSAELNREWIFDTYFTNNSGVQGISITIPEEQLPQHIQESRQYGRENAKPLKPSTDDAVKHLLGIDTEQEPFVIDSMAWIITEDHRVDHFPRHGEPAPKIAMFPDFRPLANSLNKGLVSAGIQWGVFRFSHCER